MVTMQRNRLEFADMVRKSDAEIVLAEAQLLVAREQYPSLDIRATLNELDRMAGEVRERLGTERHPLSVAACLSRYLFSELGFVGAHDEYFEPKASYLNDVLDRRRGIPISLSVLYMEIAERAGFQIDGVGLPGHFIVKFPTPNGDLLVDPFNAGAVITLEDCAAKVEEIYSGAVEFQPFMVGAVTKRQILARTVHNLKTIFVAGRRYEKALSMVELLLILAPWDLDEIRDRGMIRYHLGNLDGAVEDLETYLEYSHEAGDLARVRHNVKALRRMLFHP